jgi:hypothetical protein
MKNNHPGQLPGKTKQYKKSDSYQPLRMSQSPYLQTQPFHPSETPVYNGLRELREWRP